MTLLGFLKLSCALIFGIYFLSVNLFKRSTGRSVSGRPEPEAYTFFHSKGSGMSRKELNKLLGTSQTKEEAEPAAKRIPAAKQRKLAKQQGQP